MLTQRLPDSISERVRHHITAFNEAVESDNFEDFVARFTNDAVMSFVAVPVGTFVGKGGFWPVTLRRRPTTPWPLTSVQTEGATDVVRFVWSQGGAGTLTLRWQGELLAELVVAFDSS